MGKKREIVCRYVGQGLRVADSVAIAGNTIAIFFPLIINIMS
jgi:hypothetical protein